MHSASAIPRVIPITHWGPGRIPDLVGDDIGSVVRPFQERGVPMVYVETGGPGMALHHLASGRGLGEAHAVRSAIHVYRVDLPSMRPCATSPAFFIRSVSPARGT